MDIRDRDKMKRLEKTFELNFRLTRLYANYLEYYNEVITSEMMEALSGDGSIDEKDGIVAILCQIFGLDIDGSADERVLIRDYLTPSVRIMDPEKYRNNPYYNHRESRRDLRLYSRHRWPLPSDLHIHKSRRQSACRGSSH